MPGQRPVREALWRVVPPLLIVMTGGLVYANSFAGVFLFDDKTALQELPTGGAWTLNTLLGGTLRPLVKLSLALNAAWGGTEVLWGYHAVNLTIHLFAALALFGLAHRTLRTASLAPRYGQAAPWLACVMALLWVAHPLHTQSVTYLIQRGESLMGLWYLLTLYSLGQSVGHPHPARWHLAAIGSCALGMLSKPVMITAPLTVLVYDRVFLAGSYRGAWRARRVVYLGLATTWLLLVLLLVAVPPSPEWTSGFGRYAPSLWEYARTQPGVVLHYLHLCLWPHPLVFDYAWPIARTATAIWPPMVALGGLLLATRWAFRRMPAVGFLGVWFFLILAPTSSLYPIADPAYEYRLYLPLAGVVSLVVIAGYEGLTRLRWPRPARGAAATGIVLVLVGMLGVLTIRRNEDYRSEERLWRDTIAKRPLNPRAHHNLARALAWQGRLEEAVAYYQEALRLSPQFAIAHSNLGVALRKLGRVNEAIAHYAAAIRLEPGSAQAHNNLGVALRQVGRLEEAIAQYREALRLDPNYAEAHNNLGVALVQQGKLEEAVAHFREALRLQPSLANVRTHLAEALRRQRSSP